MNHIIKFHLFVVMIITAVITSSCSGPHSIGYSLDPLEGLPVKYATPILVRNFADRRPVKERFRSDIIDDFVFYSLDKDFTASVDKEITRAMQFELANTGLEVADAGNFLIGSKPNVRVAGDILHFNVSRRDLPISTIQHGVKTLWKREQYTVLVAIKIKVIDAKSRKLIMKRTYTSKDSFSLRSEMIDVKAYTEGKPIENSKWQSAGNEYSIQLLNEHLKRVLVRARRDIVKVLAPVKLEFTKP